MKRNYTPYRKIFLILRFTMAMLLFATMGQVNAQVSCPNGMTYFSENFGTGSTPKSSPDIISTALTYEATGVLSSEGTYRVIDNTQQKPEWQNSPDHTGNGDGDMVVINGQAETFYSHVINYPQGFTPGSYTAGLFLMNVDTLGVCEPDPLLPNISFSVEYQDQNGNWQPFGGSPYIAAPVPQTPPSSPTWVPLGGTFVLPSTGSFIVTNVRIVLTDGTVGGCGNDFAMDDISFAQCPEGGPTPVQFLGITAQQSGSGVKIQWSTAQEFNSSSFEVQKSADGNTNWNSVATVAAAGNSSTVKNYEAYDPSPFNGANFYRIKQTDIDGAYTFSKIVMVSVNSDQTSVSVLANPFHNSLTLNFSSSTGQLISARLFDITGQQVALEKWTISSGTSTENFSNVSDLQPGIYILNVTGGNGEMMFNSKVIKQ